jgi:hypothetical protein
VRRARERKAVLPCADNEQAPARLGDAVVRRLYDSPAGRVPEPLQLFEDLVEIGLFGGHGQASDVLHHKGEGLEFRQSAQELRDAVARVAGRQTFAANRKWLAWWAAGDHGETSSLRPEIQRRNVGLYYPGSWVVRPVGSRGVGAPFDRCHWREAGCLEAERQTAGAGEQIYRFRRAHAVLAGAGRPGGEEPGAAGCAFLAEAHPFPGFLGAASRSWRDKFKKRPDNVPGFGSCTQKALASPPRRL